MQGVGWVMLDYQGLRAATSVSDNWEVPWKPRCALYLVMGLKGSFQPVPQLLKFPSIIRSFVLQRDWAPFSPEIAHSDVFGRDLSFAGPKAERYLVQGVKQPPGRGATPKILHHPLAPDRCTSLWKRGA